MPDNSPQTAVLHFDADSSNIMRQLVREQALAEEWRIKVKLAEMALHEVVTISAPFAAAGIVGHQQVLDIAGKALANDPR